MEIGWGIDKALQLVQISFQLYKAFLDPDENAAQEFRDLAKAHDEFHSVFEELVQVLARNNRPILIPCNSIGFTLNKITSFLGKYGLLNDVSTHRTFQQNLTKGVRTVRWKFEAKTYCAKLHNELGHHTRILTLWAQTHALRIAFEDRVGNLDIREQNREILQLLRGPQHPPNPPRQNLHVQDLPGRLQPRSPDKRAENAQPAQQCSNLDVVRRELEAFDRLFEAEARTIVQRPGNGSGEQRGQSTTDFLQIARFEIDDQYERVSNYLKRLENRKHTAPIAKPYTVAELRGDRSFSGELAAREKTLPLPPIAELPAPALPLPNGIAELEASYPPAMMPSTLRNTSSLQSFSFPEPAQRPRNPRQTSGRRRSAQSLPVNLDRASIYATQRLKLWEAELEGTPVTPDITPNAPGSPELHHLTPSHSHANSIANSRSRQGSIDNSSWKHLAEGASVRNGYLSCGRCRPACPTTLDTARRSTGGLSIRIRCTASVATTVLLRHDLKSSQPVYPQIYHPIDNPSLSLSVQLSGSTTRIDMFRSGRKISIPKDLQPYYTFTSPDHVHAFQEAVFHKALLGTFNLSSLESSASSRHSLRNVTLRIWRDEPDVFASPSLGFDLPVPQPLLMVYAKLIDDRDHFYYIQSRDAFGDTVTSRDKKVKLKVRETRQESTGRRERRVSKDSGISGMSWSSTTTDGEADAAAIGKIKWIEAEFRDATERVEFMRIWG